MVPVPAWLITNLCCVLSLILPGSMIRGHELWVLTPLPGRSEPCGTYLKESASTEGLVFTNYVQKSDSLHLLWCAGTQCFVSITTWNSSLQLKISQGFCPLGTNLVCFLTGKWQKKNCTIAALIFCFVNITKYSKEDSSVSEAVINQCKTVKFNKKSQN